MATTCIKNANRRYQLILRHKVTGGDKIIVDVLGTGDAPDAVQTFIDNKETKPGIHLLEGLSGLYHLPVEVPTESGAYEEGCTPSEWPRVEERKGRLSFGTSADDQQTFEYLESVLWHILETHWTCILRIYNWNGSWRDLTIQLSQSPADQTKYDLGQRCWAIHTIDYLAPDPFWYTSELTFTLKRTDMELQPDGVTYLGHVPVTNPADWHCFLQWANGPMTEPEQWTITDAVLRPLDPDDVDPAQLTIGREIPIPELPVGANFHVETSPTAERLWIETVNDIQVPSLIPGIQPENAIPAHVTDPIMLPVKLVGGSDDSQIRCYMPQRWQRYFGGQRVVLS